MLSMVNNYLNAKLYMEKAGSPVTSLITFKNGGRFDLDGGTWQINGGTSEMLVVGVVASTGNTEGVQTF